MGTTGGFVGNPADAFNPPSAGGCCGSPAAGGAAGGTCCGSAVATAEAGACCAPEAKADAIASGTGCCG